MECEVVLSPTRPNLTPTVTHAKIYEGIVARHAHKPYLGAVYGFKAALRMGASLPTDELPVVLLVCKRTPHQGGGYFLQTAPFRKSV